MSEPRGTSGIGPWFAGLWRRWRYWRTYGSYAEQQKRAERADARPVDDWLDSLRRSRPDGHSDYLDRCDETFERVYSRQKASDLYQTKDAARSVTRDLPVREATGVGNEPGPRAANSHASDGDAS